MKKILIWTTLFLLTLVYIFTRVPVKVSAAIVYDTASDDSIATAIEMDLEDTASGSITESDDLDYYKFTLPSAGCLTLDMASYMRYYCIRIYDSDGEEVWCTEWNEWTKTVGYRRDSYNVYFEKGLYYMQINGYRYQNYYKSTGKYECKISFLSSGVNNNEDDNTFASANKVKLGDEMIGQISENDDYDIYKYELSHTGCVTLDMTAYMKYYCIKIYNADGDLIWDTDRNEWTESVGYRRDLYNVYLKKGVYYMQINGFKYAASYKTAGKYVLLTQFQISNVTFDQESNSNSSANEILWNRSYVGQISSNENYDTYKFQVLSKRTVVIHMTSYMRYYCIKIFDVNGKEIWSTDENEWNSEMKYRADFHNVILSAGTYYMQINGYRYASNEKSTGRYTFSLNELNQGNCNHDYKDTKVDSNYFRQGYIQHKCKKCGKIYKDNYTAKWKLSQGSFSSWSKAEKRKIQLQWFVLKDASGYQIRYCKNKKMKKGVKILNIRNRLKTKKTIKKLSRKKKYYFQIRGYKKKGSDIVYGKWSPKKCLNTK